MMKMRVSAATKQAHRYVYPVDLKDVNESLDIIVEKVGCSKADAIRDAIRHYAEYVHGLEVATYRSISNEQAKKDVQDYIKGKERIAADDISDALRIDMGMVNEALLELWQEGWVEPE
ncbi:MAG: hypothetical protein BME93_00010 [Methanosarcinales archaeon Met12]|nr:MAG: hypothetical protein BME93_00010 [Methanosarcinales archaeon Met12]